jgi:hypothetical protein
MLNASKYEALTSLPEHHRRAPYPNQIKMADNISADGLRSLVVNISPDGLRSLVVNISPDGLRSLVDNCCGTTETSLKLYNTASNGLETKLKLKGQWHELVDKMSVCVAYL